MTAPSTGSRVSSSLATDFWPLFWTITGGAALLTALLSVLIATVSPAGFRPRRRPELALATTRPANRPAGPGYQSHRGSKAA